MVKFKPTLLLIIFALFVASCISYEKTIHYSTTDDVVFEEARYEDRRIARSVVEIDVYADLQIAEELVGNGSGFSVHYNKKENASYILTNHHVCDVKSYMFLTYIKTTDPIPHTDVDRSRDLEIVAVDPNNDLCLLKASNDKIPPVTFKPSEKMQPWDEIYTIGAPRGVFPILTEGRFSGYIDRSKIGMGMPPYGQDFLLISGIIMGGQSGSPVYDNSGKVVGIIFAGFGSKETTGYGGLAIPSETIVRFLSRTLDE